MKTKVIFPIIIFCALLYFLSGPLYAQDLFGIIVDTEDVAFGLMHVGEIAGDMPSQGINVTCTTDRGNPWFLRIYLTEPLALEGYRYITIPNENFYWYGMNTTGSGTLVTNEEDFTEEKVVYTAPSGEGTDGVDIRIRFKLKIPQYQAKGRYQGAITLTLIEDV